MEIIDIQDYNPDIEKYWDKIYVGPFAELMQTIDNFNNQYETNIGVTKNLSWKRGSYDQAQEAIGRYVDLTGKKPKDMTQIFRFREHGAWRLNSIKTSLTNLQKMIWRLKTSGCKFDKETAMTYFNDQRKSLIYNTNDIADKDSNINVYIESHKDGLNNDRLCIVFNINKIVLDLWILDKDGERETIDTFNMGDIIISFKVPVFSFINKRVNENAIQIVFRPKGFIRTHPFVKARECWPAIHNLRGYCYGDWDSILRKNLRESDFISYLHNARQWLSSFRKGYTNPLNSPQWWSYGQKSPLRSDIFNLSYGLSISDCSNVMLGDETLTHMEDHADSDQIGNKNSEFLLHREERNIRRFQDHIKSRFNNIDINTVVNDEFVNTNHQSVEVINGEELIKKISESSLNKCILSECTTTDKCIYNYRIRTVLGKLTDEELKMENVVNESIKWFLKEIDEISKFDAIDYGNIINPHYDENDELPNMLSDLSRSYEIGIDDLVADMHQGVSDYNINPKDWYTYSNNLDLKEKYRLIGIVIRPMILPYGTMLPRLRSFDMIKEYIEHIKNTMSDLINYEPEESNDSKSSSEKVEVINRWKNQIPYFDDLTPEEQNNAIATIVNSNRRNR